MDFTELEAYVQSVWEDVLKEAKANRPREPRGKYARRSQSTLKHGGVGTAQPTTDPYTLLPEGTPQLPDKTYRVILSDPPWHYNDARGGKKGHGAAAAHYNTVPLKQLVHLPVKNLIHPEGTTHFMWATFPLLPDALTLMEAWGFTYKTVAFNWTKLNKNGGILKANGELNDFTGYGGSYTNPNGEIVLLGRSKGRMLDRQSKAIKQPILAPVGRHSEKPTEVRDRITALYGDDLPKIELFARASAPNWDSWGNQAPVS